MAHEVTVEELDAWLNDDAWRIFASSGGAGSHKRLEVANCYYRVTDRDNVIYLGPDKFDAVASYNRAP